MFPSTHSWARRTDTIGSYEHHRPIDSAFYADSHKDEAPVGPAMLENLHNIPLWVWILAIVIMLLLSGGIFWARRRRFHVSEIEVSSGPIKTKFEPDKDSETSGDLDPTSVTISRSELPPPKAAVIH
jgi:hypothetical protein